jgi:hypothetical protein
MGAHDIVCVHTMAATFDGVNMGFHQSGFGGLESTSAYGATVSRNSGQDLDFTTDSNLDGNWHGL